MDSILSNTSLLTGNHSVDTLPLTGNYSVDTQSNHTLQNITLVMKDNSLHTLCENNNSTICNKDGLGIRISTPVLTMSCGVLGNIIALIVLYTSRNEMKKTVFYTFLCFLAWTDLSGQLMTGPIAIIVYANNLVWVGGDPLCKYHACVMICFGMITPLLVCCMSIERVIGLRCPYYHERVVTKRKARVAIAACWLFVIMFCCLPFIGFGSYEHQFPGSWCFLNFHRESTSDAAYAYTYALINIVVITSIIIANSVVMFTLIQMKRTRKLHNSPSVDRRTQIKGRTKSKIKLEEETLMVWFLCANTLLFTVCCFPLNFNILINQVTGRINYAADLIALRMAIINQILDPWLYILLRKSVIFKALKFVKYRICKREQNSPRRSAKYVTNYSINGSIKVNDAHELNDRNTNDVFGKEGDNRFEIISETSDSSSSCSLDELCRSRGDYEKRRTRLSDSVFHFDRPGLESIDNKIANTEHENFYKHSLTNRKFSLPANLHHKQSPDS